MRSRRAAASAAWPRCALAGARARRWPWNWFEHRPAARRCERPLGGQRSRPACKRGGPQFMSTVLVLGASRGIGLEFVRQYRADWDRVIATARDDAGLARIQALGATPIKLDVADPASVSGLAWQLD